MNNSRGWLEYNTWTPGKIYHKAFCVGELKSTCTICLSFNVHDQQVICIIFYLPMQSMGTSNS